MTLQIWLNEGDKALHNKSNEIENLVKLKNQLKLGGVRTYTKIIKTEQLFT